MKNLLSNKLRIFMFLLRMKKALSILILALILTTGLHFGLAIHICSGQVSSIRLSFTEEKGTCQMAEKYPDKKLTIFFTNDCCRSFISFLSSDCFYEIPQPPSIKAFQNVPVTPPGYPIIIVLEEPIYLIKTSNSLPGSLRLTSVKLALLCELQC